MNNLKVNRNLLQQAKETSDGQQTSSKNPYCVNERVSGNKKSTKQTMFKYGHAEHRLISMRR